MKQQDNPNENRLPISFDPNEGLLLTVFDESAVYDPESTASLIDHLSGQTERHRIAELNARLAELRARRGLPD